MEHTMKVTWQAEDGYAGGARPHTTEIDLEEMEDFCIFEAEVRNRKDLKEAIEDYLGDCIYEDFRQKVRPAYDEVSVVEQIYEQILRNREERNGKG